MSRHGDSQASRSCRAIDRCFDHNIWNCCRCPAFGPIDPQLIVIDRIDIDVLDEGYDRNVDVAVIDDGVFQLRQQIVGRCS